MDALQPSAAAMPPVSALPGAAGLPQAPDKSAAAAKDFEAVFLSEMMSHMFDGVEVDPMFGGGNGEKMFRSLLIQQYGKVMAQGGGVGIADQLQKMMLQIQEKNGQNPEGKQQ